MTELNTPPPAPPSSGGGTKMLVGIAVTLLVLALIGFALLTGMPFGGGEPKVERPVAQAPSTIGEGTATSSTVSQLGEPGGITEVAPPAATTPATQTMLMPPTTATTVTAPPQTASSPLPAPSSRPAPDALPPGEGARSATPTPAPAPRAESSGGSGELSESAAIDRLSGFLASNNPYDVPASCLSIHSLGYSNRGYTLEVSSRDCPENRSTPRPLGAWRVDTLTREIFRQRGDGRFLKP